MFCLCCVQVSVIDDGLLKFSKLEELVLSSNNISEIPAENLPSTLKVSVLCKGPTVWLNIWNRVEKLFLRWGISLKMTLTHQCSRRCDVEMINSDCKTCAYTDFGVTCQPAVCTKQSHPPPASSPGVPRPRLKLSGLWWWYLLSYRKTLVSSHTRTQASMHTCTHAGSCWLFMR